MKNIKPFLFKYHKLIGLILCIPLILTAISGMGILIADDLLHNEKLTHIMLEIHTGEIFGIESIYVFLTGIGLLWLVISGLGMAGLFKKAKNKGI